MSMLRKRFKELQPHVLAAIDEHTHNIDLQCCENCQLRTSLYFSCIPMDDLIEQMNFVPPKHPQHGPMREFLWKVAVAAQFSRPTMECTSEMLRQPYRPALAGCSTHQDEV